MHLQVWGSNFLRQFKFPRTIQISWFCFMAKHGWRTSPNSAGSTSSNNLYCTGHACFQLQHRTVAWRTQTPKTAKQWTGAQADQHMQQADASSFFQCWGVDMGVKARIIITGTWNIIIRVQNRLLVVKGGKYAGKIVIGEKA